ncbi:MAG: hypothetical protein II649_02285 [Kiritimatiellae bacterium]|nr:hypothetical protein [Kiritimatiellia bacterium]
MKRLWILFAVCGAAFALAAEQVADLSRDGVTITVDATPRTVDPARDFYVTFTVVSPPGEKVVLPDLRDRFQGFSVAEDFAEEPITDKDGKTTSVTRWRLEPEPFARRYRLAPFAVQAGDGLFATAPVLFDPPAARDDVSGAMEVDPSKDLPPLSWKLVGICAAALAGALLVLAAAYFIFRKIRLAVRVHRMSPIERAMYELDKLLKKGLPGRGFYKDFYVELTMVVRRYIERQYGIRAPNLTTDEFLRAAGGNEAFSRASVAELKAFLESADLVKFAGLEATPEMADGATSKAKGYLTADAAQPKEKKVAGK